jgi:hypothetical protein
MKHGLLKAMLLGMILFPCALIAQVPTGAPAGSSGKCKDGTFTTAPKKQGACRGHKGVDTWYASTSASAQSSGATSAATPAETPKASGPYASPSNASAKTSPSARSQAAGGGPGSYGQHCEQRVSLLWDPLLRYDQSTFRRLGPTVAA